MKTYKCPQCGSENVSVMAMVSVRPTEFGAEVRGEIIMEPDDSSCCNDCDWEGVMMGLDLSVGRHGVDCPKMPHFGSGYLHGEHDDTPYDVDGASYCGRCHEGL